MKIEILTGALVIGFAFSSLAQPQSVPTTAPKPAQKDPSLARVKDEPNLPRVLLIGDSISMGYTVPVRNLLKDKANVHRIPTNGGPTTNGLANLQKWLGGGKWDVIHFNWGLHDLKIMPSGERQVSPKAYEKNLRELVKQLKATGAKLIWASTTPVPEGTLVPPRVPADVTVYNDIAKKIMKKNKIVIDDLYGFALPRLAELQRHENVHFTDKGSEELAKQVAASIEMALAKSKHGN